MQDSIRPGDTIYGKVITSTQLPVTIKNTHKLVQIAPGDYVEFKVQALRRGHEAPLNIVLTKRGWIFNKKYKLDTINITGIVMYGDPEIKKLKINTNKGTLLEMNIEKINIGSVLGGYVPPESSFGKVRTKFGSRKVRYSANGRRYIILKGRRKYLE